MTQETPQKLFPQATPETASLFGMHDNDEHVGQGAAESHNDSSISHASPGDLPVADLPVANASVVHSAVTHKEHASEVRAPSKHSLAKETEGFTRAATDEPAKSSPIFSALKTIVPYIIIFSIAVFLYAFFFSSVDFSSWFRRSAPQVNPKETALMALQKQNLAGYQAWVGQFYYDISDAKVIDPNADNSGNGLTNFQKYLLNLNPKSYDTMGLGISDSDALGRGTNPLTGNSLTDKQKQIVATYFDMETISNKQALAKVQKAGQVAGSATFGIPSASANGEVNAAGGFGGGQNLESGSNSAAAAAAANSGIGGQSNPMFGDLDVDQSVPGRLEIKSLNVNAPLMWSAAPDDFDRDLQSGVIHYPGTALPGQIGTSYISGHSSNYAWAKGNFNRVFTYLNNLKDGDTFKITVVQKNGKDAVLYYTVTGRKEYKPDDIAQFQNGGKSVVALSTCWPIGSTAKRLVVMGELTQVAK